jgi:ribosomal protein S26
MREKGQVIRVNCKRCGGATPKWELLIKREDSNPFPFDSIL